MQEIEIIGNRKFQSHFRVNLKWNNENNLVKIVFQKQRKTLPKALTSSQTIYLTNLDGATDRGTSQRSEKIDFYCDHEEADTKIFAYIKFFCDNFRLSKVTIVSPDMLQ